MQLLIPVYLPLPPNVAIKKWKLKGTDGLEVEVEFEIPGIFRGTLEASLQKEFGTNELVPYEAYLFGSYLHESPFEEYWNFFEWEINNPDELPKILEAIAEGEPLLERAREREYPPEDLEDEFRDSYGEHIAEDILLAYQNIRALRLETKNTEKVSNHLAEV